MVEYKYSELYAKDSIDKQLVIETDDGLVTITNTELHSEQFELTESLCSKSKLCFGCCESSSIKFKIHNIFIPLKDRWLTVTETLGGNTDVPFQIGRYKVFSDKPTADQRYRDIVTYDAMYDIINADVADWYNALLPEKTSTVTLKQFRTSFISHFGLEQEEIELVNDDMVVEKTIEPAEISGRDVITAICEINGCFGHIGRNGKFRYILLQKYVQGLYPADDLYPADPKSTRIGKSTYINCQYEDFVTHKIDKLQIRQEENDIGAIVGTGNNCYIVEDNFLVYGKSAAGLEQIAENLLSVIADVTYRPFEADCKGNPCFEVGDAVRMSTRYEIVESYILKRTLKGIQALRDAYSADGVKEYSENVNSVNRSIIQLKGKTNTLTRTVEETRSEIKDVEEGLTSTITQTAGEIRVEVEDAKNGLQSQITQTASQIRTEVSENYTTKKETGSVKAELQSSITQTASGIRSEVSATYETKTSAEANYSSLSSSITQTANEISTKVSKDSIISEINQSAEEIKISADKIELTGTTTVNEKVVFEQDGSLTAKDANIEMTGGMINIVSQEAAGNIIQLSRAGTLVQMGTDGMRSQSGTREATFQYSNVSVYNTTSEGTLVAQLLDSGKGISSYGWDSYSDARLKHDIEPLDIHERARFIYAQEPCRFKYNYDLDGHYRHGLIAQKVQNTIGTEDWALCGENLGADEKEYLTLNYLELIADLIATVQSQNERIKALEGKLNE